MESLQNDWLGMLALVFTLGLRHGFDADHLVAIDGLTRFNARARPGLARWCGLLFSLGHGAVVMTVALAVGAVAARWQVPDWVEDLGAWISIAFLLLLGFMNILVVLNTPPREAVQPAGVKGRLLCGLQRTSSPLLVAGVGALFALSFDTLSQAALFSVAATQFGGLAHSAALGLAFMLGMILADAANGLWISRLIRRADETALLVSRVFGLTVAGLSLTVAFYGIAKYLSPAVDAWSEGRELGMGLAVMAVVLGSFLLALRLARPERVRIAAGHR